MLKLHTSRQFALTFVMLALVLGVAAAATADTIHMKNGRVIRSAQVRVEGDRVYFTQYGGEVSVPLELVDRIVEDQTTGPAAMPTAPTPATPEPEAGSDETAETGEVDEAAEVPAEETQQYWQDRVRSIQAERDQVNLQIEDLKRTERAFLFSHRSTAETRQAIEDAEARLEELDQEFRELQAEARRAGVPAGWLRLPPGGGATGG